MVTRHDQDEHDVDERQSLTDENRPFAAPLAHLPEGFGHQRLKHRRGLVIEGFKLPCVGADRDKTFGEGLERAVKVAGRFEEARALRGREGRATDVLSKSIEGLVRTGLRINVEAGEKLVLAGFRGDQRAQRQSVRRGKAIDGVFEPAVRSAELLPEPFPAVVADSKGKALMLLVQPFRTVQILGKLSNRGAGAGKVEKLCEDGEVRLQRG